MKGYLFGLPAAAIVSSCLVLVKDEIASSYNRDALDLEMLEKRKSLVGKILVNFKSGKIRYNPAMEMALKHFLRNCSYYEEYLKKHHARPWYRRIYEYRYQRSRTEEFWELVTNRQDDASRFEFKRAGLMRPDTWSINRFIFNGLNIKH